MRSPTAVPRETYTAHAAHGWQFAKAFLELVTRCMGQEAGRALTDQFKAHRVRYRKPRELSEAQRQALRERMATVRAEAMEG